MRSLEIFSGAGGLAKGLEISGFDHAAFVEFNKQACVSLRENFDPKKVFHGDIREFEFKKLEKIDVVAGGPPCQPFSLGGKHKAFDDARDMFPSAIKAIELLEPKAFVFENVKGLLRETFSDYLQYIILRLTYPGALSKFKSDWRKHYKSLQMIRYDDYDAIKYRVSVSLLNSANYGVPQQRERVVIVGTRSDLKKKWIFPAITHTEEKLFWDKHVSSEYWDRLKVKTKDREVKTTAIKEKAARLMDRYGFFEPEGLPWKTVRDAIGDLPDSRLEHGIVDHIYRKGARVYPGHSGSDIDYPAKTIKAGGHGVPGGENMVRYRDGSVRYFTVFEAKRIQTFPDDFQITGAWGEALRQIGNAVPVVLAETIGRQLFSTLKSK
jgi:DNA (cytosine-5)-methyltransferase 1